MNPLTLIKSQQPIRCDGYFVNNSELKRYDKDFQKRESSLPDSIGLNN